MKFKKHGAALAVLAAVSLGGCSNELEDDIKGKNEVFISIEKNSNVNEPEDVQSTSSVKVTLSTVADSDVSFKYEVYSGTATAGEDFKAEQGYGTIKSGSRVFEVPFTVLGDEVVEGDENFYVKITEASHAKIKAGNDTSLITIKDNDIEVFLTIESTKKIMEPANGELSSSVKVNLSSVAKKDITFNYDITGITATAGMDFIADSREVMIKAGARSYEIPLIVLGDSLDEDDETVLIKIKNAINATIKENYNSSTITIQDEDEDSTVAFETSFTKVAEGAGDYKVKVNLSTASEKDVKIPFVLSGLATKNQDYELKTQSPIVVPSGSKQVTIDLDFLPDDIKEGGESVVIELLSPQNAKLGDDNIMTIFIPGDVGLNDTGVTSWYDGESFTSTSPSSDYPGQDAEFGHDAGNNVSYDGAAGLSFTKLDASGNALPSSANQYECIQDNRTGLIWESKQSTQTLPTSSGKELKDTIAQMIKDGNYSYLPSHENWRAANYKYYWFNNDRTNNGGAEGAEGLRFVNNKYPVSMNCAFPNDELPNYSNSFSHCNTEKYVKAMNMNAHCGYKDWRLSEIDELRSIHNYRATGEEAGEVEYFPNTANGDYISATPSADGTGAAWCLSAVTGQVRYCNKQVSNFIRLVRGGAQ